VTASPQGEAFVGTIFENIPRITGWEGRLPPSHFAYKAFSLRRRWPSEARSDEVLK